MGVVFTLLTWLVLRNRGRPRRRSPGRVGIERQGPHTAKPPDGVSTPDAGRRDERVPRQTRSNETSIAQRNAMNKCGVGASAGVAEAGSVLEVEQRR